MLNIKNIVDLSLPLTNNTPIYPGDPEPNIRVATTVKLLTLSQEKKFFPIGSTKAKQVDFRLIAATNIDLNEAVRTGKFRQDLYFRL